MAIEAKKNGTKVRTGVVRLSYANLFVPRASEEGAKEKYSVSLIIPKSDTSTVKAIKEAIELAKEEGRSKLGFKGAIPANLKQPLRDGDADRPDDPNYADSYFINCNSVQKPQVVARYLDPKTGKPVPLGEEDVYSGCYAFVSVNFYAYNAENKSKGIAAGLGNVQKYDDGEKLSGGSTADQDFEFEENQEAGDDFLD